MSFQLLVSWTSLFGRRNPLDLKFQIILMTQYSSDILWGSLSPWLIRKWDDFTKWECKKKTYVWTRDIPKSMSRFCIVPDSIQGRLFMDRNSSMSIPFRIFSHKPNLHNKQLSPIWISSWLDVKRIKHFQWDLGKRYVPFSYGEWAYSEHVLLFWGVIIEIIKTGRNCPRNVKALFKMFLRMCKIYQVHYRKFLM